MFYGDTIQETRQIFFKSWDKYLKKHLLSTLEQELVQVILAHPEYHYILENYELYQDQNYFPELGDTNPFLHMGLHLAIKEQVKTDRPSGIQIIYNNLLAKYKEPWQVEHVIMDHLAQCLWSAQKNNLPPNETDYLNALANA